MRVLQTPVRYPPHVGGVETHVAALSEALAADHEVTVVCAAADDVASGRETLAGVDVRRLPTPAAIANTDLTPRLPAVLARETRRADVIHTHLPTPWSADVSAFVGRLTDTPVVLTYHNDITGQGVADAIARSYNRTALRVTLDSVDRIVVTQSDYLDSSPHLDRYREKAVTVPNGVDTERFRPVRVGRDRRDALGYDPEASNLFFLSVLDDYHEYKGLDVLLDALDILRARSDPPHLVVGGDGDRRAAYERRVRDRGLSDLVAFVGYVPDDDLVAQYAAADAVVLPSTSAEQEGFGLVLLEALACGTPVVTTSVVGVADDIAADDVGRVVPSGDAQALASGIEDLLRSATGAMAARARALCRETYDWQTVATRIEEVYAAAGRQR